MHWWGGVGLVAALIFAPCGALPAAAAESKGPACLRARIGSTGYCLTLSWYVGVVKAVEERDLEVGLRFTLSRSPKGRSVPADLPLPEAGWAPGTAPSGGLLARAESVVGALASYGMLAPERGLERFVRDGGE